METKIIQIGNSKGIRIPAAILRQCEFGDTVEMEVENGSLVINNISQPRKGWDKAFRAMHEKGDDKLIDHETTTSFDESEWVW